MTRLARSEDLSVTEMDGDLFLVRAETGEIWHLDPMAAAIWNALDTPADRDELLDLFAEAFPETPGDTLAADLDRALANMIEGSLVGETGPESS